MSIKRFYNKYYLKVNKSTLLKGMLVYSFGSLGSRAINMAIYPILTFFLLKAELGYYDLIINTIYLVVPLVTFQLADGIFRMILPIKDNKEIKKIISPGITLIIYSTFILLTIILLTVMSFSTVQYNILVFLMAVFFAFNISLKQIIRGLKKNRIYVISDIVYSFSFVMLLLMFLKFFGTNLKGALFSFVIANTFSIMYLITSSKLWLYFKYQLIPDKTIIIRLLKYSMPLIPNALSWWLVGSINTWIILFMLGLEANGIYGLAFKFSSIIYILNKIFSLAWQDKVILEKENDAQYNSKVFNNLLFFLLSMVVLIILFMKPILRIIVAQEYFEVWKYIPWLLIATVFASTSSYFGAFYLSWKKTNIIFITTLSGAIITIILSLFLTKYYGLLGTSLAVCSGFFVITVLRYLNTRKQLKLKINPFLLIPMTIIGIAIGTNYYL